MVQPRNNVTSQHSSACIQEKPALQALPRYTLPTPISGSPWPFRSVNVWALTKSSLRLVQAGWARCTAPGTPAWTASLPSKSFRITFPIEPNCASVSSAKHELVASLNHPHICTLHDVGHQDGTDYLVMEYLEGETLAAAADAKVHCHSIRYCSTPSRLPTRSTRPTAKGITHRDLKPGNIMLTKSGAKLLDFGLAKLKASPAASPLSQLPDCQ